jgi:hypothetical protein
VTAAAGVGLALAFAGAFAAQARLQADLGRDNRVRSVRQLAAPPSPWGLRIAAGGLEEAASDALWLTVLPRLGKSWVEPERKSAWIERATEAMTAANPRALNPTLYAVVFLERLDRKHPGIERLLRGAMDAKIDGRLVNEDAWQLPEQLGMHRYLRWTASSGEDDLAEARRWLRTAANKPQCPTMVLDFLAELERRRGNELEGWQLYLRRAATTPVPSWREWYEAEADRERVRTILAWCRRAELAGRPFPPDAAAAAAEASPAVRRLLESFPAVQDDLFRDVLFEPATRDVAIPRLRVLDEGAGRERMVQACRQFEARYGSRPTEASELAPFFLRGLPRPPRHGTKWGLDPATGEPRIEEDAADPRLLPPEPEPPPPKPADPTPPK